MGTCSLFICWRAGTLSFKCTFWVWSGHVGSVFSVSAVRASAYRWTFLPCTQAGTFGLPFSVFTRNKQLVSFNFIETTGARNIVSFLMEYNFVFTFTVVATFASTVPCAQFPFFHTRATTLAVKAQRLFFSFRILAARTALFRHLLFRPFCKSKLWW